MSKTLHPRSAEAVWLIGVLESWRDTFDNEDDEQAWDKINALIIKLKNRKKLTSDEWMEVIFNLWESKGQED